MNARTFANPNEKAFDWDKVSRINYSSALLSPQKWFETANEMTAALAVLEPHVLAQWEITREWSRGNGIFPEHSLCGIYMMLAGLVIENLCKGHAVDELTPKEQVTRSKLEKQVANGTVKQNAILRQCWKLTSDEREQVKESGQLPRRIQGHHELPRFVTNTGLPIDITEEELLERLKRAVVWFGRYPVPTDYRNRDQKRLNNGKIYSTSWVGGADAARINALIKRLRKHLEAPESFRAASDR